MRIRPLIGFPLLHVEEPLHGWRRILKRATDLVITSIGLVVISPLLLLIAAAIKLYDGGPVIFRQTRVGRGGEMFTCSSSARWSSMPRRASRTWSI